jgi:hypothetical protein
MRTVVTVENSHPPSALDGRLLVVDFDFFFPNPLDAEHGIDLPRCQPTDGFWDRFTLATNVLLAADSNAYAGPLAWEEAGAEVLLYDAHHDAGYRRSFDDYRATGKFDCEDWTFPHHEAGARISVRYPPWRDRWPVLEPTPRIPVQRATDNGEAVNGVFTTVFACRSGAWVPAWCDDQWQQFIDAFPGTVISVDPDLRPRWPSTPPCITAAFTGRPTDAAWHPAGAAWLYSRDVAPSVGESGHHSQAE